jgi:hypothetical protein
VARAGTLFPIHHMPFTPADAKRHIQGLNPAQEKAWADIANSVLRNCDGPTGECEGKAIRVANDRAKRVGKIVKIDEAKRLVFGWAYIAKTSDGQQVTDHSGEFVADPNELEDAIYEYVETSREADDMHQGPVTGHLVESVMFTPEKIEAMGLAKDALPTGVWVGFRLEPDAFDKVLRGERTMFSIAGTAVKVEDAEDTP